MSLGRTSIDLVLIVEIKYQHLALDEPQQTSDGTSERGSSYNDENECGSREPAIDNLPDVVRDVEEHLSSDARFVHESPRGVGKDVEATWSKEVLSSAASPDELSTTEPRDYWNSNHKDCGDQVIVTLNPMYDDESDASSRSSLEDQCEVLSSVGDACSKGQSSVAEPIDLSDTEQPPLRGNETTSRSESADSNLEQLVAKPHHNFMTTQGMEKATETQTDVSHTKNRDMTQDLGRADDGYSVEEMLDSAETVDAAAREQMIDVNSSLLAQNITSDEDKDQVCIDCLEKNETAEELSGEVSEYTSMSSVELSSERSTTDQVIADVEALRELDAYLSNVVVADDHQSLDGDNLHTSIANAAAEDDDDVMEKSSSSKDDEDIISVVGSTADMNDEVDLDQTELITDHGSAEVADSWSVKNLSRDADVEVYESDVGQTDNNNNVCVETRVEDAASFVRNQTTVMVREHLTHTDNHDFNTALDPDKTAEIHEETVAGDLNISADQPELVEKVISMSPTQFAGITLSMSKDKTDDDAVPSDCHSEVLMTELVGHDVEMADAEVDAIFRGTVGASLDEKDSCSIRRVQDEEADAVDPGETDSCIQFSQISDTSNTDDFVECDIATSFPLTDKEWPLSVEDNLGPNNENNMSGTNENGMSEANRMNLQYVCTSESPDIEDQFETYRAANVARVGEGKVESFGISHSLHRQPEVNNDYIVDECEAESDQTSSDLEMSLPVGPSDKVHDVWMEDDSEVVNSKVDTKSEAAEVAAYISSPGSYLSWRLCTSTVCEPENTKDHTKSESVPNFRSVTTPQIVAYQKFCKDCKELRARVDYSDKIKNAVQSEPEDEEDESASFPHVEGIDMLPSDRLDSRLLNDNGLPPECCHSDFTKGCLETECSVQENGCVEMKPKKNETTMEGSFPVDEDLDETGECSLDTADSCDSEVDIDVTLTNFASECGNTFTTCVGIT